MSRILRSKTRLKKQQVQHMKEIVLCTNIANCTVTEIDSFEQKEFLALFELIPAKQPTGINGHRSAVNSLKRKAFRKQPSKLDSDDSIELDDLSRQKSAFGKTYGPYEYVLTHDSLLFFTLDMCIVTENRVQETLLAKKQSLLFDMMETVADQRKYEIFCEQEKQKNIILKIMIAELHKKIIFLCKE